jgi:hypothetical protein
MVFIIVGLDPTIQRISTSRSNHCTKKIRKSSDYFYGLYLVKNSLIRAL